MPLRKKKYHEREQSLNTELCLTNPVRCRRWGCPDERRGSNASEVGTDDWTAEK